MYGCTDCAAFNYNPCATDDDGSCEPITIGCPMPFACNYDVAANTLGYCDFWSCYQGCLDETACNYDQEALGDDGSCYFEEGCECDGGCCCPEGCNYPACLSDDNDGVCGCLKLLVAWIQVLATTIQWQQSLMVLAITIHAMMHRRMGVQLRCECDHG